ncbi:hypothetical protein [Falsiroseomonas oryziterrae]|uniref:hypothetical protein n=1 Tax=Falsiroseomonas oryziterrae TaxID=2911368 RepID=UPI001F1C6E2A|nr:hypothetical protein [Roseomonas sp. NPKOSM-4]
MSDTSPRPRRGGIFEPEVDEKARAKLLNGLPNPPPEPAVRWTPLGILGAVLLGAAGLGLIGVMALGLPLALVGGKLAIIVPILAIALLLRGRR